MLVLAEPTDLGEIGISKQTAFSPGAKFTSATAGFCVSFDFNDHDLVALNSLIFMSEHCMFWTAHEGSSETFIECASVKKMSAWIAKSFL